MKRLSLIAVLCIVNCALCIIKAQTAQQVLDKAAAVITQKSGATASFTLSNDKTGSMSGTIAIKGKKYQAKTAAAAVWYDGKTQWTYMANTEEVNVTTPSAERQSTMNPYAFINLYKSGYNLSMKTVGQNHEVKLTAQDKAKEISEMYVYVNKSNSVIQSVKLNHKGSWTTIAISNFKSMNLPDSRFVFNAKDYPNAEVIDLR